MTNEEDPLSQNNDDTDEQKESTLRVIKALPLFNLYSGASKLLIIGSTLTRGQLSSMAQAGNVSETALLTGSAISIILPFASAIGLWQKKKWGWWAASIYYLHATFNSIGNLVLQYDFLSGAGRLPVFGLRIGFGLLVLFFLMQKNTRELFGITTKTRRQLLLRWLLIVVIVAVVSILIELFL